VAEVVDQLWEDEVVLIPSVEGKGAAHGESEDERKLCFVLWE
jgi:hypothetical protein